MGLSLRSNHSAGSAVVHVRRTGWPDWISFCPHIFFNYWSNPKFWATFFHGENGALFMTKMGWATFWVIFLEQIWSPWRSRYLHRGKKDSLPTCMIKPCQVVNYKRL
jgi:hypothetical protein